MVMFARCGSSGTQVLRNSMENYLRLPLSGNTNRGPGAAPLRSDLRLVSFLMKQPHCVWPNLSSFAYTGRASSPWKGHS